MCSGGMMWVLRGMFGIVGYDGGTGEYKGVLELYGRCEWGNGKYQSVMRGTRGK